MSKFTPGPWYRDAHGNLKAEKATGALGMVTFSGLCLSSGAVAEANTTLIADAPALLDALELAEKFLCEQEDCLRSMGCDEPNAEPAILTARALIAKHRGEQ